MATPSPYKRVGGGLTPMGQAKRIVVVGSANMDVVLPVGRLPRAGGACFPEPARFQVSG